jgi:uncharacterized protein (TIGR01777 family)
MRQLDQHPPLLISASASGYYGDRGDELLDENAEPGTGFLAEVCQAWEREAQRAAALGVRVVRLRIGMVLGKGGALKKMLLPFKLGAGGRIGSGQQWVSWIHIADLVELIIHAIHDATSPCPVRNSGLTTELGLALHRPALLPVPAFALKAIYGEMAQALFESQRMTPGAADRSGFRFQYPTIRKALESILR